MFVHGWPAEEKDYYRPDTMVNFYVKDDDLALPTTNQNASETVDGVRR